MSTMRLLKKLPKNLFSSSFIVWVKNRPELADWAKALLEHGIIGTQDTQGTIWTIQKARGFDQRKVIDAIRCQREL